MATRTRMRAWLGVVCAIGAIGCGPQVENNSDGGGEATASSSDATTTTSTSTSSLTSEATGSPPDPSSPTTAESTESSAAATTDDPGRQTCETYSESCPPGWCCGGLTAGLTWCVQIGEPGAGCDCQTDDDCRPGMKCAPFGVEGVRSCSECATDDDCPAGESCSFKFNECEPDATSSSSSGESSSSSSGN